MVGSLSMFKHILFIKQNVLKPAINNALGLVAKVF